MQQPVQVIFLGMERSEAVEAAVRRKVEHLDRVAGNLMACRVAVDLLQKHKQQGQPFGVRIDLTLPGRELCVNRVEDQDVYVALRDAFEDIERQLAGLLQQRRGEVKQHAAELRGEVVRLNDDEGFGFIRTPDGEEYYFGRTNLASGRFEQLQVGTAVQFIAEVAGEGRQAKRISVGKHRAA